MLHHTSINHINLLQNLPSLYLQQIHNFEQLKNHEFSEVLLSWIIDRNGAASLTQEMQVYQQRNAQN